MPNSLLSCAGRCSCDVLQKWIRAAHSYSFQSKQICSTQSTRELRPLPRRAAQGCLEHSKSPANEMPLQSTFGVNYYVFRDDGNSPKRPCVNPPPIASGIFQHLVSIQGKRVILAVYLELQLERQTVWTEKVNNDLDNWFNATMQVCCVFWSPRCWCLSRGCTSLTVSQTHTDIYIQEMEEMLKWKQSSIVFLLENSPPNVGIVQNLLVLLLWSSG